MIKTSQGEVFIKGSVPELFGDLAVITRSLKYSLIDDGIPEEDADRLIIKVVEDGLSSIGCRKNPEDTCNRDADPVGEAMDRLFEALFQGCVREGK